MPTPRTKYKHLPATRGFGRLEVRTDDDGTRFYQAPCGEWYPSASTVAGWDRKDFFDKWMKDPTNFAEALRARKRGNMLHEAIERYLHNREDYLAPFKGHIRYEFLFDQIRKPLAGISNIRATEMALFSDLLKVAGRVDLVADYNDVLSVIDFKGSTKTKREDWIEHYFVQATMYSIMYHECFDIPVKQIVLLIACEDGNSQTFVRDPMDYVKQTKAAIDGFRADNEEMLVKLNGCEV